MKMLLPAECTRAESEVVMIHPLVRQFQAQAEVLEAQGSTESLDEAIATLASWMELAQDQLSDDDETVLISLGGILFREGLRKRAR
jgi:prefoldin subunit 5